MKELIQKIIQLKAKRVVRKFKPHIVAITGSVGKTSTKNAIAAVLKTKFDVRVAEGNYNNEFGVPFAVLGVKSPGKSVLGWLKILFKSEKHFPDMLVLEFGADKPGDISALCELFPPEVGVITAITGVHVENYGSDMEKLIAEKRKLIESLTVNGLAVLNSDDERVRAFVEAGKAPVVTYGFNSADVQGSEVTIETRDDFSFEPGETFASSKFTVHSKENSSELILKNTLGRGQALSALAAVAVGEHFGLSFEEMFPALASLGPIAGRLRPLPGIKGALIIDDSYNAAPASVSMALKVLAVFEPRENRRHIAVLGDMGELGTFSEAEHRNVGLQAASVVDLLVCVGEKARDIANGAREAGLEAEKIREFANSIEAGRFMDSEVKQGDIVLIKGSQSMRMEKTVKDLMAEPARASELLVRQYGKWLVS
ncbi:MAG: UDP-N-acetylmuramoyl-tripeptide--D-alanyl-D-alanine ligase [Patescibacteria group bacterium]|jgi:UDP-N-acetylmuramoyl-tripeptide--D-alanyl-D-alanine ligase